jgi:hypothetical protein
MEKWALSVGFRAARKTWLGVDLEPARAATTMTTTTAAERLWRPPSGAW